MVGFITQCFTSSEEEAFTSPASDYSMEQTKRTEGSEWHLFNEHQKERHSKIPHTVPCEEYVRNKKEYSPDELVRVCRSW